MEAVPERVKLNPSEGEVFCEGCHCCNEKSVSQASHAAVR